MMPNEFAASPFANLPIANLPIAHLPAATACITGLRHLAPGGDLRRPGVFSFRSPGHGTAPGQNTDRAAGDCGKRPNLPVDLGGAVTSAPVFLRP